MSANVYIKMHYYKSDCSTMVPPVIHIMPSLPHNATARQHIISAEKQTQ